MQTESSAPHDEQSCWSSSNNITPTKEREKIVTLAHTELQIIYIFLALSMYFFAIFGANYPTSFHIKLSQISYTISSFYEKND